MLTRYQIVRGKRAGDLPQGVRQDTRKHTRHPLRPEDADVARFLADPTAAAWQTFQQAYLSGVAERLAQDRAPFDDLAELARTQDVYLGCNCPTAKNPDVRHCHTVLALRFMKRHYRDLDVRIPSSERGAQLP